MNAKRRGKLKYAASLLDKAGIIINECKDEESDCMVNIEGTSLENTDMYLKMANACECLEYAFEDIESVRNNIYEAMC